MSMDRRDLLAAFTYLSATAAESRASTDRVRRRPPLKIKDQGSFAVGGTVVGDASAYDQGRPDPKHQTVHGDHAYIWYQIPEKARRLPLVMLHGAGQSARTWETTPDGREGFQNIFLRRGFPVYLIDQPRRGRGGRSTQSEMLGPLSGDQEIFNLFRLGVWPDYFPGVQFSRDPAALDQYFSQATPNTGPFDPDMIARTVATLFTKIGPGTLITHSQGGGPGWKAAINSSDVRAIVAFEPGGSFVFPEGEIPPPVVDLAVPLTATGISTAEFMRLTKIPIVIYYGDNIPDQPSANRGQDNWRPRLAMAKRWRDAVNSRGGDVTLIHLPKIGISGNTHFAFSDLNNIEIADLVSAFLMHKRLD